jgi:porphobilinogen deaminase
MTHACVLAERSIVAAVDGDCHSPIGVLAQIIGEKIWVRAVIGRRDGEPPTIAAEAKMPFIDLPHAVNAVIAQLRERGVGKLLHGLADS